MKKQHKKELKQTRSQISQETSTSVEVFTINETKQADRFNEAADQKFLNAENNGSSAQSELSSDIIISNTNNLKANAADGGEEITNTISEDSNLQRQISERPDIVSEKKRHDQVKKFTESVSHFYSIRANRLYECEEEECYDLAIETIKTTKENIDAGKILIALAAHAAWSRTPAHKGGRGNKAAPGEGRMRVLEKFSTDCLAKGVTISPKTLIDYVGRIQKLIEEPLKQFEGRRSKEFIARKRAEMIDNLFLVPMGFLKIAAQTDKPAKALEIACEKMAEKNKKFTENQYDEAISHLKKNEAISRLKKNVINGKDGTTILSFDKVIFSQLEVVAGQANISFDLVVEIYVSILQVQLSMFKDMGMKQ